VTSEPVPAEAGADRAAHEAAANGPQDGERRPGPLALVIVGASGDLTSRKVLPAIASLAKRGMLGDAFTVVGVARTEMTDDAFRDLARRAVPDGGDPWEELVRRFRYVTGEYGDPATFAKLADVLDEADRDLGTGGNRVYYLATVPSVFGLVAGALAAHGCNHPATGGTFARLVVEKPFGTDLESARALDTAVHAAFPEEDVYRIDHYMGKETVQNVLALRFANAIFEPVWNRRYVDHVQVTVAESLGVEHRGGFYEGAGALRDIVQNHVMQVLALTLMEPPSSMDPTGIRDEKVKVLRSIVVPPLDEVADSVVRGQYTAGTIDGEPVPAYREEEGVSPQSTTETFVAMHLHVDNWRWADVPVYVRTGKRLPHRATEVAMMFQRAPHLPFAGKLVRDLRPDALVLRIQPDEGIKLRFGVKVPGQSFRVRSVDMDFTYAETFGTSSADAYERLLLDAMVGDPTLFIRADEVTQAWQIVAPIQEAFADSEPPLGRYAAGTWGPHDADRLVEGYGRQWHNP
jgi:glucose-6-phosphate 1-dehydrogenase